MEEEMEARPEVILAGRDGRWNRSVLEHHEEAVEEGGGDVISLQELVREENGSGGLVEVDLNGLWGGGV